MIKDLLVTRTKRQNNLIQITFLFKDTWVSLFRAVTVDQSLD